MPISSPGTFNPISTGIDQTDTQSVGSSDPSPAAQAYRAALGQEAFRAQTEKVGAILQGIREMGAQLGALGRDVHHALESGDSAGAAGPIAQYQAASANREAAIDSLRGESRLLRAMLPEQTPGVVPQERGALPAPAESGAFPSAGSMPEMMSAEGVPGSGLQHWKGAQAEAKSIIKTMDQAQDRINRVAVLLADLDIKIERAQRHGDQASAIKLLEQRDQLVDEKSGMQMKQLECQMQLQQIVDQDWPVDDALLPVLATGLPYLEAIRMKSYASGTCATAFIAAFSSEKPDPAGSTASPNNHTLAYVCRPRPGVDERTVQDQIAKINHLKVSLIKTQQALTKAEFKIECLLPDGDPSTLSQLFNQKEAMAKGLEREIANLEFATTKLQGMVLDERDEWNRMTPFSRDWGYMPPT